MMLLESKGRVVVEMVGYDDVIVTKLIFTEVRTINAADSKL